MSIYTEKLNLDLGLAGIKTCSIDYVIDGGKEYATRITWGDGLHRIDLTDMIDERTINKQLRRALEFVDAPTPHRYLTA